MFESSVHTNSIEVKIAKLYLFFLPFRMIMPLSWLADYIGPLGGSFDLLFHLFGLFLWNCNEGGFRFSAINSPLFNTLRTSIILLNVSSVIMSIVMYFSFGELNGKSPFFAIIPMMLFYFQYLLMFLYNIRVFTILDYQTIVRQLRRICIVLLVLAYIQIVVMRGIGAGIYDAVVNVVGGINPSSKLPKLCLTLSEGAAAGCLIGVFVLPFILARIIHGEKRAKYELVLWLIPIYYTHSSTAMLLVLFDMLLFSYLMAKNSANGRKFVTNVIGGAVFVGMVAIVFLMSGLIQSEIIEDVNYLVFEKIGDDENGSTISRSVPLYINWGCFTEMPVLGVGNGLQGYFFNKYFPMQYLMVRGSDVGVFFERAQTGIANGGCFWPGYLSGYGIFGLCILINIILKMKTTIDSRRYNLGLFREMFIIGALSFFPLGMQGEAYSLYFAWFVIAIPFMYYSPLEMKYEK